MIGDLKPYADYKESGLPWLGQVPGHWDALPVKQAFNIQLGKMLQSAPQATTDSLAPYFKSQHVHWAGVRTGELPHMWASPYELEQYGVRDGDLLVCEGGEGGRCAVLSATPPGAIVQNALHRVRPRGNNQNRFLAQVMAAVSAVGWFDAINNKATIAHFTRDKFGGLGIPLPPPDEQAAIVRFLDWANGRLERAIRAKRKVIALLGEQKQAIIHRAVTRGLDPSVPLKPSGIPWLGDIPEHWDLWRISRFARVGNGSTPSRANPSYWHGGLYPWLNSSQVNRAHIDSADQFVTQLALRECHLPKVPVGSVLVAITGQGKTRGMSAVLSIEATINQHIAFITPRMPVTSPEFIHIALTAAYLQLRASSDDSGSTKGAITCEGLKRFKLPMPPRAEQEALLQRTHIETREVDTASTRLEREIELLREYRTRLVADVVTGKLDVREAASRLPDEALLDTGEDDLNNETEAADEEAAE